MVLLGFHLSISFKKSAHYGNQQMKGHGDAVESQREADPQIASYRKFADSRERLRMDPGRRFESEGLSKMRAESFGLLSVL
jgi:hypothetical protein